MENEIYVVYKLLPPGNPDSECHCEIIGYYNNAEDAYEYCEKKNSWAFYDEYVYSPAKEMRKINDAD